MKSKGLEAEKLEISRWQTTTLSSAPWGDRVARVLERAIQAVDPGEAVSRFLKRDGNRLTAAGRNFDLERYRRVFVIGAGKAGAPMAAAAAGILDEKIEAGVVIVKEGHTGLGKRDQVAALSRIALLEAGHPIPDERSLAGARRLQELLAGTRPDDLVIALLSGGGSALLASPAPGLTLDDLQELTSALLASGASINEINALRKHLDLVKGGGLARLVAPATLITLILSDVIGDPLDVIASGPTVPDPSTFAGALQVLEKYNITAKVPQPVIEILRKGLRGELPETPKPGDELFAGVQNLVIGSNIQAAQAGMLQAQAEGFQTLLLTTYLQGEARHAGRFLGAIGLQIAASGQPLPRPACIIAGGETTVTLKGDGLGGRNQEMALGAVTDLAGLERMALVTLATDGGDGPTDAAGAVVTGETLPQALDQGLNPADFLSRNDSYHFFDALGDLLRPGPTQTNVNDLAFLFAF